MRPTLRVVSREANRPAGTARYFAQVCLVLIAAAVTLPSPAVAQNLLRNPGFEAVPGTTQGQGLLPSEWDFSAVSPDTFSNDGSYGLPPSGFGNFTGVVAFEGIRWMAGWSSAGEQFGQTLSAPLVGGEAYTISARLHQAVRTDLADPGGYRILLADAGAASPMEVATLGLTVPGPGWQFFETTFIAPADAASRPLLIFDPVADSMASSAYPGIDDLSLVGAAPAVPALGLGLRGLMLLGLMGAAIGRLRSADGRSLPRF